MKKLILFIVLSAFTSAFAQTKNGNPMVKELQPSSATGSSQAIIVDQVPLAHTSQFLPLNKKGEIIGAGNISKQTAQVLKNVNLALKKAKSSLDQVVKINVYVSNGDFIPEIQKLFSQKFRKTVKPATSFVVGELAYAGADIAIDVIAISKISTPGKISYFQSPALYGRTGLAHVSVLPAGGVTYVSGQADKGDLTTATRGTIKKLDETLKHLDIQKNQVIQIKSFMQPMADVRIVEDELARYFEGQNVPPLVFVDWVSKNPVIEIELIASSSSATGKKTEQMSFATPTGMTASPIYSRVSQINHGKKLYVSALYGNTVNDPVKQTVEIFESLKQILNSAGSDFAHLAKATYYVAEQKASTALNVIRPAFYDPARPPAASKAMVKGVGGGKSINIDMIGVVKN